MNIQAGSLLSTLRTKSMNTSKQTNKPERFRHKQESSLCLLLMSQPKTGCKYNCSAAWLQSTDPIPSVTLETMALLFKEKNPEKMSFPLKSATNLAQPNPPADFSALQLYSVLLTASSDLVLHSAIGTKC